MLNPRGTGRLASSIRINPATERTEHPEKGDADLGSGVLCALGALCGIRKDPGVVLSLILFILLIGVATVHSYEINLAGTWYLAASSAESYDEAAPPQDVSVWKAIELPNLRPRPR